MPKNSSILLVGCGKLGGALLNGWLASPTPPRLVVLDRHRTNEDPDYTTVRVASEIPTDFQPDIIVLAVKPAAADAIITELCITLGQRLSRSAFLSVMAGRTCDGLAAAARSAGINAPVIRAMPNTPSAIGAGTSGFYVPPTATERQHTLCHDLLCAVGDVVRVEHEADLAAVTAISGSGPAYVFLLAELLEEAGIKHGLPAPVARRLARGTVYGAGRMLDDCPEDASALRKAVTSPKGTTAAALDVLMSPDAWPTSISKAIDAAARRAEELAG
ncbi:pyrroline-5-carboxylate reductase [Gluconobacter wancherniae]|uniref:pyrroline-5-carboxylate reductase n=1 Tax=Gluconobacter wancherniae TaxID=1307955 RepID=UPI001B8C8ABE|nr:pyrroline-5-carboxylate reductase [Gluconobacter wancherniae]MBS1095719.1 pyrroline-5-carboxylate reductase [Gluconobacter wancherniae]